MKGNLTRTRKVTLLYYFNTPGKFKKSFLQMNFNRRFSNTVKLLPVLAPPEGWLD